MFPCYLLGTNIGFGDISVHERAKSGDIPAQNKLKPVSHTRSRGGINTISGVEAAAVHDSAARNSGRPTNSGREIRPNYPQRAQLRLMLSDDLNRRWVICSTSPPFSIGRSSKCEIVLSKRAHPSVSSQHLSIGYNTSQHAFEARDTSSSGTMVNDHFLRNDVLMLQLGDILFVGGAVTGKRFHIYLRERGRGGVG